MRIFLLALLCVFTTVKTQIYDASLISDELRKNANVIVQENTEQYTINSIDDIEIKHNKIWTILKSDGSDSGNIALHYDRFTKVDDLKVSVINAFGREERKYAKKDFSDYSNTPSFGLYDDNRVLVLRIGSIAYPYTIKLSYTVRTSDTVFISDFQGIDNYNTSTLLYKRVINNKSGIPLRFQVKDTELGKVNVETNGTIQTFTYQNVPALKHETKSPSLRSISPRVEFSLERFTLAGKTGDLKNWDSFGQWYYTNLLQPSTIITPEIKKEVDALGLSGTTEDKVRTIFQFMQEKTRYIYVGIGIGGWKPMQVEDVRKKGYGDCKALTNYMRAMLEAAGIPSYYAIITSDETPISFSNDFPKIGGNHAVLMVPNGEQTIWLENTSQTIAFNHLSYNTTNRNALAIKPQGVEIVNTPVYPTQENLENINATIKLKEDRSIDVSSKFVYKGGQYDTNMALVGLSKKDMEEGLKSKFNNLKFNSLEISDFKNDKNKAQINYQLQFVASEYSKKLGDDLFFSVVPFYDFTINTSDTERKLPFENIFAYHDDYTFEYEAPNGYAFKDLPSKPIEVTSEFGSYKIDFKLVDNKLKVNRVITINNGTYSKEKYIDYINFRKKILNSDNTKILISKS